MDGLESALIYPTASDDTRQRSGGENFESMPAGSEGVLRAVENAKVVDNVEIIGDQLVVYSDVAGGDWTEYKETMVSAVEEDFASILGAAKKYCEDK